MLNFLPGPLSLPERWPYIISDVNGSSCVAGGFVDRIFVDTSFISVFRGQGGVVSSTYRRWARPSSRADAAPCPRGHACTTAPRRRDDQPSDAETAAIVAELGAELEETRETILQLEACKADRQTNDADNINFGNHAQLATAGPYVIDVSLSSLPTARFATRPARKAGATEDAKGWRHLPTAM